jgi:hypothetical protein
MILSHADNFVGKLSDKHEERQKLQMKWPELLVASRIGSLNFLL